MFKLLTSIFSLCFVTKTNYIDRSIRAPSHGKYLVDGINACDKQHLKQYIERNNYPYEVDEDRKIKPYLIDQNKFVSLAD